MEVDKVLNNIKLVDVDYILEISCAAHIWASSFSFPFLEVLAIDHLKLPTNHRLK